MTNTIENVMVGISQSLNEEQNTIRSKRLATYGKENFEALYMALQASREAALPNVAEVMKEARGTDDKTNKDNPPVQSDSSSEKKSSGFFSWFKKSKDR